MIEATVEKESESVPREEFEAEARVSPFKAFHAALSALTDEAKVHVGPDGLAVRAVDTAHVSMVDARLDKAAFLRFRATEFDLGIDLTKLKEFLGIVRAGQESSFGMRFDPARNRIVLTARNTTRTMSLVDTAGMSDPKVNLDKYAATVRVRVDDFKRALKAAADVTDAVKLTATPAGLTVEGKGDTDDVETTFPKVHLTALTVKGAKVRSRFPLDDLTKLVDACDGYEMEIGLGDDYPIRLAWDLRGWSGDTTTCGRVTVYLAPRIEDEYEAKPTPPEPVVMPASTTTQEDIEEMREREDESDHDEA